MRVGVHIVRFEAHATEGFDSADGIAGMLAKAGAAADAVGLDNLSVMDHYLQLGGRIGAETDPMLEGYTTLGYLAAQSRTPELQLLVTGVTYRHPGLLAKVVTTLDVLSGGRAVLGLGAAWYQREHDALGVPFPPVSERFERLEETLQIVRQMWSDDDGPFEGRHYQLAATICSPRPIAKPHPPIMIGGSGEKKTLRLVAKYADACNVFAGPSAPPDQIAAKLAVLRGHCDREGTDYDAIRKTVLYVGPLDPAGDDGFLGIMRELAGVGIQEVHVMPGGDPATFIEALGESMLPRLAEL